MFDERHLGGRSGSGYGLRTAFHLGRASEALLVAYLCSGRVGQTGEVSKTRQKAAQQDCLTPFGLAVVVVVVVCV